MSFEYSGDLMDSSAVNCWSRHSVGGGSFDGHSGEDSKLYKIKKPNCCFRNYVRPHTNLDTMPNTGYLKIQCLASAFLERRLEMWKMTGSMWGLSRNSFSGMWKKWIGAKTGEDEWQVRNWGKWLFQIIGLTLIDDGRPLSSAHLLYFIVTT